jgi:hypothetical protein
MGHNWEELSKLSRTELLAMAQRDVERVLHTGGWREKLAAIIHTRLASHSRMNAHPSPLRLPIPGTWRSLIPAPAAPCLLTPLLNLSTLAPQCFRHGIEERERRSPCVTNVLKAGPGGRSSTG